MYIYYMVYYRVITTPYVRSVIMSLHTVKLMVTIRILNAKWTISILYSLKCFR